MTVRSLPVAVCLSAITLRDGEVSSPTDTVTPRSSWSTRSRSSRPSAWLMATAGMLGWLANLPKKMPSWLLKTIAPTAPASATRFTFSSNVMSPRSISAIRPSRPSAGMSSSNARSTYVSRPVAIPWMDGLMGTVCGASGASPVGSTSSTLRDRQRDAELLDRCIVAQVVEPAAQVLGGLKLLVCRALSRAVLLG